MMGIYGITLQWSISYILKHNISITINTHQSHFSSLKTSVCPMEQLLVRAIYPNSDIYHPSLFSLSIYIYILLLLP